MKPRLYEPGGKGLPPFEPETLYLEIVDETLYDTVHLHARQVHMFLATVGQGDYSDPLKAVKDLSTTNMWMPGSLPAPQKMLIERWHCRFLYRGRALPLLPKREWWRFWEPRLFHQLYQQTRLTLQIARKTYAAANALDICDFTLGEHNPLVGEFSRPIPLETLMPFSVDIEVPIVNPEYSIYVALSGKMLRPQC